MKHATLWQSILSELHEDWMDDADKAFFDKSLTEQYGAEFDANIDAGLANGFTIEQQKEAVLKILSSR